MHREPAALPEMPRREVAVLPDGEAGHPARRCAAAVLQAALRTGAPSASAELASQLERELWPALVSWSVLVAAWRHLAVVAPEMVRPSEVLGLARSAQPAASARQAAAPRREASALVCERVAPQSGAAAVCGQAVQPLVAAELASRPGVAAWDAPAARQPEGVASDAGVAPQQVAEAEASDAGAAPQQVAEAEGSDAGAALQQAAEVPGLDVPAGPRRAAARQAVQDVRERLRAARPLALPLAPPWAVPSVCRRDRLLPWPEPRRAARFARAKRMLRAASPSARSWQAARDEGLT
jgi:hypothetical protein